MRRFLALTLLWLFFAGRAQAQSGVILHVSPPDTANFPTLTTYVQVWDAAGNFLEDLEARHFTLIEDGRYRAVEKAQSLRTGVQLALAVVPGESMAIRDATGRSRWEYLQAFWTTWAQERSEPDDVSLVMPAQEVTHRAGWLALAQALAEATPDFAAPPALTALSRALDVASDPTPRPGMGRAVLLMTAPLPVTPEMTAGIQTLAALAGQRGVRVSVWLVGARALADAPEAEVWRDLSSATGGQFALIATPEDIPDPTPLLEPLRHAYRLTYTARPAVGEEHTLQVWLHTPQGEALSEPLPFALTVRPPNPIFVQPPLEVVRRPAGQSRQALLQVENYTPQTVSVEVLVEFPDHRPRALRRVTLLLDGRVLAEQREPPFERFSWDVRGVTVNEQHRLRLEAEDELGLVGRSIEIPVTVRVVQPTERLSWLLVLRAPQLAVVIAGLVLAALLLGLVFSGRLTPPRPFVERVHDWRTRLPQVESPPAVAPMRRLIGTRLRWPQAVAQSPTPARLEGVEGGFVLPLTGAEVTLGSDPARAVAVLEDASVSPLHARLKRVDEQFVLLDAGSVAGTWVNFEPVPPDGVPLQHGDWVHLGRVALRFWLAGHTLPEPQVLPLQEDGYANR